MIMGCKVYFIEVAGKWDTTRQEIFFEKEGKSL